MNDSVVIRRAVTRYNKGEVISDEDDVVTEYPLTIMLNGEEFVTLVCSPDHVEDLAVGFLASEGMLSGFSSLTDISYDDRTGHVYAEADPVDEWLKERGSKRYFTSCCGKSRQGFVFYNDARTAKRISSQTVKLTYGDCIRMMSEMQQASRLFRETGGVHNAALFERDGTLLLSRLDIGRHNALDKIYGYILRNELSMDGKVLAFSGRVSSEVLLKAAKMGCEVLLSKSAATDLAIGLAEELGITVVGFIRGGSLNVYAHPDRVQPETDNDL